MQRFFVVDCILTSLKLIFHSHFHSQWSEGSHKHNIDILPKFWTLSVWECEIHHDCVTRYDSCSHKKAVMMRSFKRWLHGHFVKRSLVEAWAHMYAQLILCYIKKLWFPTFLQSCATQNLRQNGFMVQAHHFKNWNESKVAWHRNLVFSFGWPIAIQAYSSEISIKDCVLNYKSVWWLHNWY